MPRRLLIFLPRNCTSAALGAALRFEGGAYLKIVPDKFTFLYFYLTVHFLSVNFPMDWYETNSKSRITRAVHAVKKTRELHGNESENISGESEILCRCGTIYNVQSISMSLSLSLSESTCFSWLYGIPRLSTPSGMRRLGGRRLLTFCPRCGAYSMAALNRGRRLFE